MFAPIDEGSHYLPSVFNKPFAILITYLLPIFFNFMEFPVLFLTLLRAFHSDYCSRSTCIGDPFRNVCSKVTFKDEDKDGIEHEGRT